MALPVALLYATHPHPSVSLAAHTLFCAIVRHADAVRGPPGLQRAPQEGGSAAPAFAACSSSAHDWVRSGMEAAYFPAKRQPLCGLQASEGMHDCFFDLT